MGGAKTGGNFYLVLSLALRLEFHISTHQQFYSNLLLFFADQANKPDTFNIPTNTYKCVAHHWAFLMTICTCICMPCDYKCAFQEECRLMLRTIHFVNNVR